jgi:protein-arginine kinase activator protein McsA
MEVTQRELEEAVKKEDFEKAARLRDEIKKLERKGAGTTEE